MKQKAEANLVLGSLGIAGIKPFGHGLHGRTHRQNTVQAKEHGFFKAFSVQIREICVIRVQESRQLLLSLVHGFSKQLKVGSRKRIRREASSRRVEITRIDSAGHRRIVDRHLNQRMIVTVDLVSAQRRLCVTAGQSAGEAVAPDGISHHLIRARRDSVNLIRSLSLLRHHIVIIVRASADVISNHRHGRQGVRRVSEGPGDAAICDGWR